MRPKNFGGLPSTDSTLKGAIKEGEGKSGALREVGLSGRRKKEVWKEQKREGKVGHVVGVVEEVQRVVFLEAC